MKKKKDKQEKTGGTNTDQERVRQEYRRKRRAKDHSAIKYRRECSIKLADRSTLLFEMLINITLKGVKGRSIYTAAGGEIVPILGNPL